MMSNVAIYTHVHGCGKNCLRYVVMVMGVVTLRSASKRVDKEGSDVNLRTFAESCVHWTECRPEVVVVFQRSSHPALLAGTRGALGLDLLRGLGVTG